MSLFVRSLTRNRIRSMVHRHLHYVMLSLLLFFSTGCATTNLVLLPKKEANFPKVNQIIQEAFPDVRHISTEELSRLLGKPDQSLILLLDVREREEYDVSHLPSAISVTPIANLDYLQSKVAKDQLIVTYCSVGYRSAILARKLQKIGYTNVRNLEGSLFAWVNEGRSLYQGGQLVTKAHPYDKSWGKLLKEEYRAFIEENENENEPGPHR